MVRNLTSWEITLIPVSYSSVHFASHSCVHSQLSSIDKQAILSQIKNLSGLKPMSSIKVRIEGKNKTPTWFPDHMN